MDVLTRTSRFVGSIGAGIEKSLPRHYLEPVALFDRCRSLLGAIRVLVYDGFAHEAMMLNRPLFTDSLALAEMAAADESRRAELALGWELQTLADFRGVMLEGQARGDDVTATLETLEERKRQVEEYARRQGLNPRHWQADDHVKRLAAEHGRSDEYLDFRVVAASSRSCRRSVARRRSL